MTAYRFCRTDDVALLLEATARCRDDDEPPVPPADRAGFMHLVRDLDLWCSSCMVAFEGDEPVAVLLGAKRPDASLVHDLRVHPDHRRRGHARHLLTSLGQKLAILGPPHLVAEVPARRGAAATAFAACGWQIESRLRDWLRPGATAAPAGERSAGLAIVDVGLDEIATSGALDGGVCWQRDLPALRRRAASIAGVGCCSAERLEAWALYEPATGGAPWQLLRLGCEPGELGQRALACTLAALGERAADAPLALERAAPREAPPDLLASLGFVAGDETLRFTAEARPA